MSEPAAPSIASTLSSIAEQDCETTWNALESGAARGWCESSMDAVLRRLQGLQRRLRVTERDQPPFEGMMVHTQRCISESLRSHSAGDLKIVISTDPVDHTSKAGLAAIRLKESDDDSCLWWIRSEDEALRNIIKATLR